MAPAPLALRFWQRRRIEPLLQSESAECGLVCIAMIAAYWGLHCELVALRQRCAISLKGASLRMLIQMAESLGLQARPLKVPLENLPALRRPAVLHWDLNHFVVLSRCDASGIRIADPAVGERTLAWAEVSRHFTGVALELQPGSGFRPQPRSAPWRLRALLGPVRGLRGALARLLALSLCLQLCTLLAPYYVQWVVDEALVSGERPLLAVLGIGAMLLVLLQAGVAAVRSWQGTALATVLGFQWQGQVLQHLLRLPLAFFERRHLGDVVSRFGAVQALQRALTTQFVESLLDGLLVVTTFVLMLAYSGPLAGLALTGMAAYAGLRAALLPSLRAANAELIAHAARAQTHLIETVRGVQTVRLGDRATERRNGWLTHLARQFNAELGTARLALLSQSGNQVLFGLERAAIVWCAALAVLDARLTVGMLFAFLGYKDQFTQRLAALIDRLCEWRVLRLQGERVADIVLHDVEADADLAPDAATDAAAACGDIELRNVTYRYADGEPPVLDGLDLLIPAGQSLVITGASGCGKTTLVKLLLGLHRPQSGEILCGGRPLAHIGLDRYRRSVGSVMQDDHLFSGSVAENISFFDPEAQPARIAACARLAAVHEDIVAMPMAYQTLVGENGGSLSGGQRQRLLLARALYRRPQLLVLDEATSHLDAVNEQRINASLRELPLTRVIVAHRAETIATAQRVVWLERGRVVRDQMARDQSARGHLCAAAGAAQTQ